MLAAAVLLIAIWEFKVLFFLPASIRLGLFSFPWSNWRTLRLPDIQPGSLSGKIALVTGGSSGIGLETAKALALGGCHVIIAVRDTSKAQSIPPFSSSANVEWAHLNLANLTSVKTFVSTLSVPRIDYLVLNAGSNANGKALTTLDGFELMFGSHHVGHFYLFSSLNTRGMLPQGSRIVVTSSALMAGVSEISWKSLENPQATPDLWPLFYHQSKLANVLFALEGQKKFPGFIFSVNHPGLVRTPILGENSICEKFPGFCFEPEAGAVPNILGCVAEDAKGQFILPGGFYASPADLTEASKNSTLAQELWDWTESALAVRQF